MVSIPHVKLVEDDGDEGLLVKTGVGNGLLRVDCDDMQLACRGEIGDIVLSKSMA
jgi:hypothetical protein